MRQVYSTSPVAGQEVVPRGTAALWSLPIAACQILATNSRARESSRCGVTASEKQWPLCSSSQTGLKSIASLAGAQSMCLSDVSSDAEALGLLHRRH